MLQMSSSFTFVCTTDANSLQGHTALYAQAISTMSGRFSLGVRILFKSRHEPESRFR